MPKFYDYKTLLELLLQLCHWIKTKPEVNVNYKIIVEKGEEHIKRILLDY